MKRFIVLSILGLLVSSLAAAELKVAIIDVQKVFDDYYKTKEVSDLLKAREDSLLKSYRGLQYDGQKLMEEVKSLRELSEDKTLSYKEREVKKREFEFKSSELDRFGQKFQAIRSESMQQLETQANRLHSQIREDVMKAAVDLGQKEGYHLLFNANKANPMASDVLFAKGVDDVTEKVLAKLNATKPVRAVQPEPKR
ncbi:MAG TPA: OmpH family outer membrane protein [Verrucomicrobiae bacterium]|jgi:outer membrane protein